MSDSSSNTTALGVIPGGTPTKHQDYVPSLGFLGFYLVMIPFALWRIFSGNSRMGLLIRPIAFEVIRIATFAIRIIQAQKQDKGETLSKTLIQTEDIILAIGLQIVVEPTLHLLFRHKLAAIVDFHSTADHARRLAGMISTYLLYAGILAGVYAGNMANKPDKANLVKTLRIANTIVSLMICGIILSVSLYCFVFNPGKNRNIEYAHRTSLLLTFWGLCMAVASGFRFINATRKPPADLNEYYADSLKSSTKVQFYAFQATPEVLALGPWFILNIRNLFQTYLKLPFAYQGPESEYLAEQGKFRFEEKEQGPEESSWLTRKLTFGYY